MISQLTVFLENEKGRLAGACRTIADAKINMQALFLADTEDFGIARIFCDTPNAAVEALMSAGYRANIAKVVAIKVPHREGGLAEVLEFLDTQNVNIEYAYCFSISNDYAIDVLRIDDESVEQKLTDAGFTLVAPEEVYVVD